MVDDAVQTETQTEQQTETQTEQPPEHIPLKPTRTKITEHYITSNLERVVVEEQDEN